MHLLMLLDSKFQNQIEIENGNEISRTWTMLWIHFIYLQLSIHSWKSTGFFVCEYIDALWLFQLKKRGEKEWKHTANAV